MTATFDDDKARAVLWVAVDWLGWGDDEKGDTSDRPELLVRAVDRWVEKLAACVVEDPRIARIEDLCDRAEKDHRYAADGVFAGVYWVTNRVRAILRGES